MSQSQTPSASLPGTVAFIGLGNMGGPMAANLVAAGVTVRGFDLVPAAVEAARATGVEIADDAASAVPGADVVITMLPNGALVRGVYEGTADAPGLLGAADPDTLFLDCSTISTSEAQEVAALAEAAGHRAADAPVSGGVVGAQAGTLAFMVGGSVEVFEEIRPLLEVMGSRIVHCGGNGLGQAAKVCNNMLLAISQIGVAEAFVLGERLGLEHQVLFDVMSEATGRCWSLTANCPVPGPVPTSPANRDFEGGFAGALMAKDLGLALKALDEQHVGAEMGRLAQRAYAAYADGEGARKDFSGIIETVREAGKDTAA